MKTKLVTLYCLVEDDYLHSATVDGGYRILGDAAFIVRAVNAHDDLMAVALNSLAVARNLRQTLMGRNAGTEADRAFDTAIMEMANDFTEQAKSAIAKGEER